MACGWRQVLRKREALLLWQRPLVRRVRPSEPRAVGPVTAPGLAPVVFPVRRKPVAVAVASIMVLGMSVSFVRV